MSIVDIKMAEVRPEIVPVKRLDYGKVKEFLDEGIPVFSNIDKKLAWKAKRKLERETGRKVACFRAWFNKPGYVFIYEK